LQNRIVTLNNNGIKPEKFDYNLKLVNTHSKYQNGIFTWRFLRYTSVDKSLTLLHVVCFSCFVSTFLQEKMCDGLNRSNVELCRWALTKTQPRVYFVTPAETVQW